MTNRIRIALMIAAGGAALAPALAQTAPAPVARPMADGVMTRAEATAGVDRMFARLDTDRNGVLTQAEREAGGAAMRAEMKERMSTMRQKMAMKRANPGEMFDKMDTDRNGSISRAEFDAHHAEHAKMRMDHAGMAPRAPTVVIRTPGAMKMHGGMMALADGNKDGNITLQEAQAAALQHFDQMDANRDGQVTREERQAARGTMHNAHR